MIEIFKPAVPALAKFAERNSVPRVRRRARRRMGLCLRHAAG
jgi:hypothetical protein